MTSPVRKRATDSSGRPVYASDKLWTVWQRIVADPRVKSFAHLIVITQGSWMSKAGGGAAASAGVHDRGGCFDIRSRTLTATQRTTLIRVLRDYAGGAWFRDKAHGGFDEEHIHVVFGWDDDLAPAAFRQWTAYLNGRNGLASNGPDYHDRPRPMVTKPPAVSKPKPPKPKPPRMGVIAARRFGVLSLRFAKLAASRLAKSKDPVLRQAAAEFTETANRNTRTLSRMPKK